jgi:uncharacterized membrane protein
VTARLPGYAMLRHALTSRSTASAAAHQASSRIERLWEIDAVRGIAVVLMVCFHLIWSLQFFGFIAVNINALPWQVFARSIGSSFIFLLGLSLALRHARQGLAIGYLLRRAGLLLGLGMLITVVTFLFIGAQYVRFGILHLLGAATLLVWPFVFLRPRWSIVVGLGFLGAGWLLGQTAAPFPWLIWLGVPQAGLWMVDYYPVLPWSGMALFGVGAGLSIARVGVAQHALSRFARARPIKALRWLGQHSLIIYLLHQPVLIGLLLGYQLLREAVF